MRSQLFHQRVLLLDNLLTKTEGAKVVLYRSLPVQIFRESKQGMIQFFQPEAIPQTANDLELVYGGAHYSRTRFQPAGVLETGDES